MKGYDGCDGRPHGPSGDLGGFSASGSPKNLTADGSADTKDGVAKPAIGDNAKGALAEYGGISAAKKISSLSAKGESIDIPREGYNDPANLKV